MKVVPIMFLLWTTVLISLVGGPILWSDLALDSFKRGTTESGLLVEVLDAQGMCSGECVGDAPPSFSRSFPRYVSHAMTLRITNESEKDPKFVRPCNWAIFPSEWLDVNDVDGPYEQQWELVDDEGIDQRVVDDEDLEVASEGAVYCSSGSGYVAEDGVQLPLKHGESMTIAICQTSGAPRYPDRDQASTLLYRDDGAFLIAVPVSLVDFQEQGGEFNRVYGEVCD